MRTKIGLKNKCNKIIRDKIEKKNNYKNYIYIKKRIKRRRSKLNIKIK
jgi:hypothetical protein